MDTAIGYLSSAVTKLTGGYGCEQNHAHNSEEDANKCNKISERERQKLEKEMKEKADLQQENKKLTDEMNALKIDNARLIATTSKCCVIS